MPRGADADACAVGQPTGDRGQTFIHGSRRAAPAGIRPARGPVRRRGNRSRRRAAHPGSRGRAHASRLCRRPRARVRAAPVGRQLRGHRPRWRRHPLHRGRHARGQRRATAGGRPAPRPRPAGRWRDHARDQERLRARLCHRGTLSAGCARSGPEHRPDGAHQLSRRARAAARIRGPARRLHRRRHRLDARAAGRGPGRRRRRLLRTHRLHAGADAPRLRGRARSACP